MRQIKNINYAVCINAKVGYCEVTWTQSQAYGDYSFTVSDDGDIPTNQLKSSEYQLKSSKYSKLVEEQ